MRLAVFTNKYPARVATFFERDMRGLLEAGVEVEIFTIYPLDADCWPYALDLLSEDVLPRDRVHHLSIPAALAEAARLPAYRIARAAGDAAVITAAAARYGPETLAKSAYVLPKAWAWAHRHTDRFDHVLGYWGNYAGTCAYAFHRLLGREIPFSLWLHAGVDLYRTPVFMRQKLRYADSIITCCGFNKKFLRKEFGDLGPEMLDKVRVCYHGLNLADFPFAPEGRPARRVIAVGRLVPQKGFDYLLQAARLLRDRGQTVEVEFVGDGEDRQALEAMAARLGIAEQVTFRGWLPFSGVRDAMSAATVLVHSSGGLGDGLPNVLREAMALGTPVIASDVAGIPEALDRGRCGVLVPPRDIEALAGAIATVLDDRELRHRLAHFGRAHTERWFDLWRNGAWLAEHLRGVSRRDGGQCEHVLAEDGVPDETTVSATDATPIPTGALPA
ncbi:MAG: glycosyltransferase [Gemmatimonadetes bacterium]|nr:glycosyltransferase [Gemmatimonadota bacterium]